MSKFCKYCGNELDNNAKFCGACGNKTDDSGDNITVNEFTYSNNNNNIDESKNENPFILYFVDIFKKKYVMFNGRASRKEYWMFTLFVAITLMVVLIADGILGTNGVIYGICWLAALLPSIAAAIRRLHDIGKSGFWCFISFVPIVGGIWLLVLLCTRSDQRPNKYGDVPVI